MLDDLAVIVCVIILPCCSLLFPAVPMIPGRLFSPLRGEQHCLPVLEGLCVPIVWEQRELFAAWSNRVSPSGRGVIW